MFVSFLPLSVRVWDSGNQRKIEKERENRDKHHFIIVIIISSGLPLQVRCYCLRLLAAGGWTIGRSNCVGSKESRYWWLGVYCLTTKLRLLSASWFTVDSHQPCEWLTGNERESSPTVHKNATNSRILLIPYRNMAKKVYLIIIIFLLKNLQNKKVSLLKSTMILKILKKVANNLITCKKNSSLIRIVIQRSSKDSVYRKFFLLKTF